MTTITMMAAVLAAAPLQCPGSGFVEQAAERPAEGGVGRRFETEEARIEGFTATVTLDDGKPPRMILPRRFMDFPGYTSMVARSDDGDRLDMIRVMGLRVVRAQYDRRSGILVISVPEGRWVGRCERATR
jgi:hypothetical protein